MQTSSANRRILTSCLMILLVLCICLSLTSIVGAGIIYLIQTGRTSTENNPIETEVENSNLEIDQQMDQIENQISEIRGWEPKSKVDRNFLTTSQLHQHVLDDFLDDYSSQDAQNDALVLWTFGLLERNFDLYNFYVDLYSEQIAGFYDQKTKQMFVVQDNEFSGPERLTYAHEFVHALQDQNYNIENGLNFNDDICQTETERCAAVSALLEGDASLSEAFWFSSYATLVDQREVSQFYNNFASPVYDGSPQFMKEDFIFPYQEGQNFVQNLYDSGGWENVNKAYNNPPKSTEQILHPEKYPDDVPETIILPDLNMTLGQGWEEIDRGTMGEWYTYLILAFGLEEKGRVSQSVSAKAAEGWEGDSYVVFYNESIDSVFMVLLTKWESLKEADEFKAAFTTNADNRFGKSIDTNDNFTFWENSTSIQSIWSEGVYSAWCISPNQALIESVWSKIQSP